MFGDDDLQGKSKRVSPLRPRERRQRCPSEGYRSPFPIRSLSHLSTLVQFVSTSIFETPIPLMDVTLKVPLTPIYSS